MKKLLRSNSRKKPSENNNSGNKEFGTDYARYSNIIYLLIGSVAFSFALGCFLDWIFDFSFPLFKVTLSFSGVILGLYLVFKELNRK